MGVYNPNLPRALGMEWVPIRNEDLQFQPDSTSLELGYGFSLATAHQLNNARFYVNQLPPNQPNNNNAAVNIYPQGQEALSGPIKTVIIPLNNAALTGNAFFATINGDSVPDALYSPSDFKSIVFQNSTNANALSGSFFAYFATNDYAQVLKGKRILNVSLRYSGWCTMEDDTGRNVPFQRKPDVNWLQATTVILQAPVSGGQVTYGREIDSELGALEGLSNTGTDIASGVPTQTGQTIARLNLGDICPLPTATLPNFAWTYDVLRRLDLRNGFDMQIYVLFQVPAPNVTQYPTSAFFALTYMAMEVAYCEETRVATGSTKLFYNQGINTMLMTDLNLAQNPILPAGDYTVTLSFLNPGDQAFLASNISGPFAKLNAIREKYAIRTLPGVEVDIPFPSYSRTGEMFAKSTTHIIPQVTLHTSGGPFFETHPYGRQATAYVYGNVTASQNLLDGGLGGATTLPWVRWYARRFGNTTVPLTLTGTSPTVSGSSASISVSDFDALDEILDGWKEITLRFSSPPSMGTGVNPTWTWSATGELIGNRWEVLGAAAPAISGITSNPYLNPGPPSAQLGPATYGQPTAGSTIQLTWAPGIQPPVSGATADPFSDATLIFSQDMPTVTGFTVTVANQPLSGVSLDCVAYPWYVPTSMAYNNLTWSATSSSTPVSGFGYYELQRMDAIGNTWETIAELTSPFASGFRDYEARVGILNSYRIRSVNSLLFPGQWSSTVTSTFTSPGLTGQGINATSRTLTFTSNKGQDGSKTLAYAMAFSNDTTEAFNFPEAGFTQFQFMYGRDYQTAFRPLERGGTTFQRTVLVQAAAISPPTLADFTSLRDLAWASLPYVCVRDEDGNRWYANVDVPTGRVAMNNREIYLADLTIVEVTATPAITVI